MTRLTINLCTEVVRELDFRGQCAFARAAGYDGLEVAPFTLAADPTALSDRKVAEFRRIAESEGIAIAGLHWLLAEPAGLSITSPDAAVARTTREAGRRLVDLCTGLGGTYLVHGSPGQRQIEPGHEKECRDQAFAYFVAVADAAVAAGVRYVVEPLARVDTGLVNTLDEALDLIARIGSPALATMVDCYAASANDEDIPALLDRWLPTGAIFHVHFNDDDRRGPGQGKIDFAAILKVLKSHGYSGSTAVEPVVYVPDGPGSAARAIGYLRGLEAAIEAGAAGDRA
jgi:sugar phosphate isomerase/epimerase